MKKVFLALLLGSSILVMAHAAPAYAQSTEQTDQSEEDWRKSQKKRDTTDIFEDILNNRNIGSGNGYGPPNPIETLPEESRRHLLKERAKILATSEPGTTPDTPYNPSEAAKSDSDLQEQEKEAWEDIVEDLKGGGQGDQSGQGGQGSADKVADAGQSGGSPGGQSSGGGGEPSSSRSGYKGPTPLRGGSSASVADILARIKGLQPRSGYGGGSSPTGSETGTGSGTGIGEIPNDGFGQGQTQGPLGSGGGSQGHNLHLGKVRVRVNLHLGKANRDRANKVNQLKVRDSRDKGNKVKANLDKPSRVKARKASLHWDRVKQAKTNRVNLHYAADPARR